MESRSPGPALAQAVGPHPDCRENSWVVAAIQDLPIIFFTPEGLLFRTFPGGVRSKESFGGEERDKVLQENGLK